MTPPSPELLQGATLSFTITVNGEVLETAQVLTIETWSQVNRVPRARIVLYDGSAAEQDFPASNLKTLIPGNTLRIEAGYNGKNTTIFEGIIIRQGISIALEGSSRLIVDASDKALAMTLERNNAVYPKTTDSALIEKLIGASGLSKNVTSTRVVYEDIVQFYASDWDLMLTRAELNGFVVTVKAGKVTVAPPDTSQNAVLLVEYGDSIMDLDAELDAVSQYTPSAIKAFSWDESVQKIIQAAAKNVPVAEQGNVTSATLAQVFNVASFNLETGAMLDKASLEAWASASLLKSKLSKIRGNVRFQGCALAEPGKVLELGGLSERFNGKAFISGVHHELTEGRWLTTATLGLAWPWFTAETPNIAAPGASGQLPPARGLHTGKVKQVARDPTGEFRVLLTLPLLADAANGVWARLGTLYASNKAGQLFFPEIDDEVIVGFMNEDPRFPIILGSVYSSKLPPPHAPDEANNTKAIVTRGKLEILFNDKDIVLQLNTPARQTVTLNDKTGSITISDSNDNSIVLSKSGIAIASSSNLSLTAKGNITIAAQANLGMSAKANATLDALQIAATAKAKISAQGNAAADLKSTGIVTVQGSLVKIN